jgi:tetratricopeptide (TPR) repeat protein
MSVTPKSMARRILTAIAVIVVGVAATCLWREWSQPNPQDLMRQARGALTRGDTASAREFADRVLSRFPEHGDANLFRCDLALTDGDLSAATRFLSHIPDHPAPLAAKARFREGTIQLQQGRGVAAESSLRKALALDPQSREAERTLRDLYMLQLRRDDFRQLMRSRRQSRPWDLSDLMDFVVAGHVPRFLIGNWFERVNALAQGDPDDLHSQIALALYHSALGRHQEAADVAQSILDRTPDQPIATAILADSLVVLGQIERAQSVMAQRPPLPAEHPWLTRCRGRLAILAEDHRSAQEYFAECLKRDPGNPSAMYQLGLCLDRNGATDDAATMLRCGRDLTMLIDRAQNIIQLSVADPRSREALKQIVSMAELLAESELWEDSLYCSEFVLRADPQNRRAALLAPAAARHLEQTDSIQPPAAVRGRQVSFADRPRIQVSSGSPSPNQVELRLQDRSNNVGLSFQYFTGDTGNKYLFETLGGGVSAFDYDGDGWPDLYFAQGSHFPEASGGEPFSDQLFRNSYGIEWISVTDQSGLGDTHFTIGCTAADFDNDGFVDLFIANFGRNRAYRNNGDGSFADVSEALGVAVVGMNTSLALADLDRDGDLDLYVVNYVTAIDVCKDRRGAVFACHPSMFQAEQDVLFENDGSGHFLNVTASSGIEVPDGKGLGIVVADLDNDGWPDVFISNDSTPNFLFRNRCGETGTVGSSPPRLALEECGLSAGAALSRDGRARAGMGIACGDLDGNGWLDLYVTNYNRELNAVFLNQGHMTFVDSVRPATLVADTAPLLGFGTQAIDVDLDGNLDLIVTNGHVDDYRNQDRDTLWKMPPKLYHNYGGLEFGDVSSRAGPFFNGTYLGRTVARLDWNRDGRPDVVVVHQNEPAALLENITVTPFHSAVIDLVGTVSNRDAVNARLWVTTGSTRRTVEITGGDGYLATNERRQVIGLGNHAVIDRLEIAWPGGRRDSYASLPADKHLVIAEGRMPVIRELPLDR